MKPLRVLSLVCLAVLFAAVACEPLFAQCAMCGASVQNSTDAEAASKTLDLAALILLVPPVTIFAGLFGAFYRFRNVQGGTATRIAAEERTVVEEPPTEA